MRRHPPLPANPDGGGLPGKGKHIQLQPNHGSVNILLRPHLPFPPLGGVLLPRCFPVALSALPSPPSPPSSSSSPSATSSSCLSPPSPPFRPPYQCQRQCVIVTGNHHHLQYDIHQVLVVLPGPRLLLQGAHHCSSPGHLCAAGSFFIISVV